MWCIFQVMPVMEIRISVAKTFKGFNTREGIQGSTRRREGIQGSTRRREGIQGSTALGEGRGSRGPTSFQLHSKVPVCTDQSL